jgi:hypothetical protein
MPKFSLAIRALLNSSPALIPSLPTYCMTLAHITSDVIHGALRTSGSKSADRCSVRHAPFKLVVELDGERHQNLREQRRQRQSAGNIHAVAGFGSGSRSTRFKGDRRRQKHRGYRQSGDDFNYPKISLTFSKIDELRSAGLFSTFSVAANCSINFRCSRVSLVGVSTRTW